MGYFRSGMVGRVEVKAVNVLLTARTMRCEPAHRWGTRAPMAIYKPGVEHLKGNMLARSLSGPIIFNFEYRDG